MCVCGYKMAAVHRLSPSYRWSIGLVFLICLVAKITADGIGCSDVKYVYISKGFNSQDVPGKAIQGDLKICPSGFTCCTREMEHKLNYQSRQEFDRILRETINMLKNTFNTRTQRFDEFFTELLKNSKRDLHTMFLRTYGMLYQQNSHVFTDLFRVLENYYKGSNINLLDALDNFFTALYQKMFELLNSQYTFSESYLSCVSEFMEELQPFGDVPQKLSMQVKRAFVAARTFVQGLAVGRDVIKVIMQLNSSSECSKALMKMTYCPHCRGLLDLKPCNNYCINVMKGCLAYHAELNDDWNSYIDALMMVADRLEGPFNIESVVDPIHVKISEAIMNFQESGPQVSNKVFSGCGQPRLEKRDIRNKELTYDTLKFGGKDDEPRPTTAAGTSLDRLVRDIKDKVKVARGFWSNLPYSLCNNEKVAESPTKEENCWNGIRKARYMPEIIGDGIRNQVNNPEVEMDVTKPNSAINQVVLQLKLITSKLKSAHNGQDVEWIDSSDWLGSGSGSGSGSGDDVTGETSEDDFAFTSSTMPAEVARPPEPTPSLSAPSNSAISFIVLPAVILIMLHLWC